jgi:predicted Fe-Mo cluster-binding NifX family protein
MLIAITSEGLEPSSLVAEKFGKTPFIIFYDTDENTYESLHNPYANLFGGAGIQTAQFIIGNNAAAVISIDIGLNPLRLLKSAGVEVYSCSKIRVQEVVNEYIAGNLSIIKQESFYDISKKGRRRKRRNWNKNI